MLLYTFFSLKISFFFFFFGVFKKKNHLSCRSGELVLEVLVVPSV